jgi:hypothetical protein
MKHLKKFLNKWKKRSLKCHKHEAIMICKFDACKKCIEICNECADACEEEHG